MNFVFTIVLIAGILLLTIASPETALSSFLHGAERGVTFCLQLLAVYAVWLSVLQLWEKTHVMRFLSEKSKPLLRRLFPGENDLCYENLSVNLSANFLGMGGAGTPAGIRATKEMTHAKNRTMLLVVNSTSVQLIPATIVALRAAQNATKDIILPTLLSTVISTFLGIVCVKVFVRK